METDGIRWKLLYRTRPWARLTPTLTHVVTYELVTSGAEDRAMSMGQCGSTQAMLVSDYDPEVTPIPARV